MRFSNILATSSLFLSVFAQQDLNGLLKSQDNLTEFTTLLNQYPDVFKNISSMRDITLFAPSNDAMSKLNYSILAPAFSSGNVDFIRQLLYYHVSPGLHPTTSLTGNFQFLPSLLNNRTYTNVTSGQVIAAVEQAGNVSVAVTGLGSRSTLTINVCLCGSQLLPSQQPFLTSLQDLKYDNGIVHVIDTIFIPPQDFTTSAPSFNLSSTPGAFFTGPPILEEYLDIGPSLTVFAPNNDAFQKISSSLSSLSVQDLTALLEYHIIPSKTTPFYSSNLPNGLPYKNDPNNIYNQSQLTTLQGKNLTITFLYNSLFVNQARVIQQDLLLSNGVLHVIDSVLSPNASNVQADPLAKTPVQVVPGTATGGLPFTEALPTSTTQLFSLVTATPTDSGSAQTGGSGARTTTDSGGPQSSSRGLADRVEVRTAEMGWVFGVAVWILGFL